MGQSHVQHAGTMPSPDKLAWHRWYYRGLRAKMNEHLWTADRVIYVDASAGGGGDGSSGTPYNTCAAADADRAATPNDHVEIRIAGMFTGLVADPFASSDDIAYTRFMQWQGKAKAILTPGTRVTGTSGWTLDTGTRYTRSFTGDIAFIVPVAHFWNPGYEAASQAAATTYANTIPEVPFSWFWAANVLSIDWGVAVAAAHDLLVCPLNTALTGFDLTANMTSCWGLTCIGWGTDNSTDEFPFVSRVSSTESSLFYDCDGLGGCTHSVVHELAGSGGIATFVNCRAGLMADAGGTISLAERGSLTPFNSYATTGGQEVVWHNCTIPCALVVSQSWYVPSTELAKKTMYGGKTHFGHTGAGNSGLHICYFEPGVEVSPDRVGGCHSVGAIADCAAPSASDAWADYSTIFYGMRMRRLKGLVDSPNFRLTMQGNLFLGTDYEARWGDNSVGALEVNDGEGAHKNCLWIIHGDEQTLGDSCCLINGTNITSITTWFENCTFVAVKPRDNLVGYTRETATTSDAGPRIRDCICLIVDTETSITQIGVQNNALRTQGLLVTNPGTAGVSNIVDLQDYDGLIFFDPRTPPATGDMRIVAHARNGTIEYDAMLRKRGSIKTLGHLAAEDKILVAGSQIGAAGNRQLIGGSLIGTVFDNS